MAEQSKPHDAVEIMNAAAYVAVAVISGVAMYLALVLIFSLERMPS